MKSASNALAAGRIALAAFAVALCAAGPAAAQGKKTLVFVVNGASDFWKIAEAGVKKAQGELPKYTLQFKYPEQPRLNPGIIMPIDKAILGELSPKAALDEAALAWNTIMAEVGYTEDVA